MYICITSASNVGHQSPMHRFHLLHSRPHLGRREGKFEPLGTWSPQESNTPSHMSHIRSAQKKKGTFTIPEPPMCCVYYGPTNAPEIRELQAPSSMVSLSPMSSRDFCQATSNEIRPRRTETRNSCSSAAISAFTRLDAEVSA